MRFDARMILARLLDRRSLSQEQARLTFDAIMSGEVPEALMASILTAMAAKGECVDELVGAAEAMRAKSVRIHTDGDCLDTCGTGGDGISTINTSTAAAIIAASAGATVAKHGNRSTTRASGSTEVLTCLGIDVDAPPAVVERCLREVRIGYLNARNLHPAMKHAAPVRQALPFRTVFNLLGPLTNPAGAKRQLLGVPRVELVDIMAEALHRLGVDLAWVVHGSDGLCDLSITGESHIAEVTPHGIRRFVLKPESLGLTRSSLDGLRIDGPEQSAQRILQIFRGASDSARDHVLLNAGAALLVAGLVEGLAEGIDRAGRAVGAGEAVDTLERWRELAPICSV